MKKHIFTAAIIMLAIGAQAQANKKTDNAQQAQPVPAEQAQPGANKKPASAQQAQPASTEQAIPNKKRNPPSSAQQAPEATSRDAAATPATDAPGQENDKRRAAGAEPTVMPDGTAAPATTGEQDKAKPRGKVARQPHGKAAPGQNAAGPAKQNASPRSAVKKPSQQQATPAT